MTEQLAVSVAPGRGSPGRNVYIGKPLSERQKAFMNAVEREQLFGGAKYGGKTVAGSIKAIWLSLFFPGNRGYILRQDLTDLRESTLETFLKICPRELILSHHQTYRRIQIRTAGEPSTIIYSGLSDESDEESSKGKECGWFWIDEPSEVRESTYLTYLAQLRWSLPNGTFPPFMALLTSNPEPGWVEERFRPLIEQASESKPVVTSGSRVFVRSLPKDNPYKPANWEAEMRLSAPEAWVHKYIEGSWEVSESQVYKEFDRATHVIPMPPPDYLKTLKLVGALDHATTGVTCFCINGIDPDGNIIALGSYYDRNKLISEHSAGIKLLADDWVRRCGHPIDGYHGRVFGQHPAFDFFDYVLIDPSTQAKTQQSNNELSSNQDLYWREGIPTLAAYNAIDPGVQLMQEYLHIKPTHIHPFKQSRPSPSYFIVGESNQDGIREMIGWKKTISDTGTVKYVGPDHWLDCQRYIVVSRPTPPRFTTQDLIHMDTHARIAQRAMAQFDKKFVPGTGDNQWWPGGSGTGNTWWPQRVQ